jgi:hypothetical protein
MSDGKVKRTLNRVVVRFVRSRSFRTSAVLKYRPQSDTTSLKGVEEVLKADQARNRDFEPRVFLDWKKPTVSEKVSEDGKMEYSYAI